MSQKVVKAVLAGSTALLGLWLIIEISVFPRVEALWIAFATAIGIALVALAHVGVAAAGRDSLSAVTATTTVLVAGVLIAAPLVFEGASRDWLVATGGGVVELLALGGAAFSSTAELPGRTAAGSGATHEIRPAA